MPKVELLEDSDEELSYRFFCSGCGCSHFFRVRYKTYTRNSPDRPQGIALWTWNGDFEKPTVNPSIHCNPNHPPTRCHSWIKGGTIEYFGDSYHHLKNSTVVLEDIDD